VRRQHIFEDCVQLYTENLHNILQEFPFHIHYTDERAIDTGGVSQDMLSSFWEDAYIVAFNGGNFLVPAVHPGTDMAKLPVLGGHNVPWITFLQLSSHSVGISHHCCCLA